MTLTIGTNPDAWGVWTTSDQERVPWATFLDGAATAGYEVVELGSYGYLPTDPAVLRSELDRRGLGLAAGYLGGLSPAPDRRARVLEQARSVGGLVAAAGGTHLLVLAASYRDAAGQATGPKRWDDQTWPLVVDLLAEVTDLAVDELGLAITFHPHIDSAVETPADVERLLGDTDDRVGLCLDVGQLTYLGFDAIDLLRRHSRRVNYVHLRDLDSDVTPACRAADVPFAPAVQRGIFCDPGLGMVDLPGFARALAEIGFDGPAVVERSLLGASAADAEATGSRARAYFASIGLATVPEAKGASARIRVDENASPAGAAATSPAARPAQPHDLTSAHLVISQFSMDRSTPWATRAAAASAAGFDGIGLWVRDAPDVDPAEVVDIVAEHGIVLSELEALSGWASSGTDYDTCRELEAAAYAVADATGARHMQVWGSYEGDLADAAKAFGEVCDRAADHGLLIALEFLPFTNIPDARTAMEIIERAGRPNGGLCVDVWHHERGARSWEQLSSMPPEWVVAVQLDDGASTPVDPDYYTDCVQHRVAPGEGAFDLVTFLRLLREIGADAPLAVEVLSTETAGQPPAETAAHLFAATTAVRDEAWGTRGASTPTVSPGR